MDVITIVVISITPISPRNLHFLNFWYHSTYIVTCVSICQIGLFKDQDGLKCLLSNVLSKVKYFPVTCHTSHTTYLPTNLHGTYKEKYLNENQCDVYFISCQTFFPRPFVIMTLLCKLATIHDLASLHTKWQEWER